MDIEPNWRASQDFGADATQFEALATQAVDAVKAGASPEDDRIEFMDSTSILPGAQSSREFPFASIERCLASDFGRNGSPPDEAKNR